MRLAGSRVARAHLEFHRVLGEGLVGHEDRVLAAPLQQGGEAALVLGPPRVHLLRGDGGHHVDNVHTETNCTKTSSNPIVMTTIRGLNVNIFKILQNIK